jgi:hypothetical protein
VKEGKKKIGASEEQRKIEYKKGARHIILIHDSHSSNEGIWILTKERGLLTAGESISAQDVSGAFRRDGVEHVRHFIQRQVLLVVG